VLPACGLISLVFWFFSSSVESCSDQGSQIFSRDVRQLVLGLDFPICWLEFLGVLWWWLVVSGIVIALLHSFAD
jgi:hypothetical protein